MKGIITVTANPLSKYEDVEPEILALRKIPYVKSLFFFFIQKHLRTLN